MAKLRLLFTKEAQASYISHLDTMRTFQRVFPRAELHLKHSNGFHPHPIISIVLPLPVGQSSDCELLDFETVEETDGAGIAEKLNTGLPAGQSMEMLFPIDEELTTKWEADGVKPATTNAFAFVSTDSGIKTFNAAE